MKFQELVKTRKSVREYLPKEVEDEKLDYILECARLAPSAVNFQPWFFIVVKQAEFKSKLRQCYNREWFSTAPMYIVACGDTSQSWKRKTDGKDHMDIDLAIAIEHICLAAAEQGLGSCWVCNFDINLCKQLFELPEHIQPVTLIPIGYATKSDIKAQPRKEREDIVIIQ